MPIFKKLQLAFRGMKERKKQAKERNIKIQHAALRLEKVHSDVLLSSLITMSGSFQPDTI